MNIVYIFFQSQSGKESKNLYKLLLLLSLSAALISSCKKEQSSPYGQIINLAGIGMVEHYSGIDNIKVDGSFTFQSNVTNNDSTYKNTAEVEGFFSDKSGLVQKGGGPVSIGGYQIQLDSPGDIVYGLDSSLPKKAFYGTDVTFSLTPPNNNNIPVIGSLYSPMPVYITNVAPITALTITQGSSTLITWNMDPNNLNGVVLSAKGNGYTQGASVLVPDNGSYTLPWSFFSKFSANSQITLWAERGNYAILQSGQNKYKIGGYSATAIWEVEIKP